MSEPLARPTFLCHAYAAWKLIAAGKNEEAEDELAKGFGFSVHRIHKDKRLLGKLTLYDHMTPEMAAVTGKRLMELYEMQFNKKAQTAPTDPEKSAP